MQPLPDLQEVGMAQLRDLVRRRLEGVPLAHLSGRQHFMGLELEVTADALVPRVETELLGNAALSILKNLQSAAMPRSIIDVCTGCGNLALAIAVAAPDAKVWGADLSPAAVKLASRNAGRLGLGDRVSFRDGDLLAPFDSPDFHGKVDMIICNPPYISSGKVDTLAGEIIGHEPRLAFDGGPLGISIVSRLIKEAPRLLKPGGWLCFEVGLGQGRGVRQRLALQKTFDEIRDVVDAEGQVRALLACALAPAETAAKTAQEGDYTLDRVEPLDQEAPILECWRNGLFSGGSDRQKFDWYYRHNVAGVPDVYMLRSAGQPVGVGSAGHRELWHAGGRLTARVPFDFVIDEAHRNLFPALFVQRGIRAASLAEGPLMFTSPNDKSRGVFMRAGYKRLGDLQRRTRVLRAAFYLRRHLPAAISRAIGAVADTLRHGILLAQGVGGMHTTWETRADATFDDLFRSAASSETLVGTRDARFLNWRFAQCPFDTFRLFTLRTVPRGPLLAYAACRSQDGHMHVDDFLFAPQATGLATAFWRRLAYTAYREECISLNTHFLGGPDVAAAMRRAGMVDRGGQPVFACASDTLPGGLAGINWFLTPADFDT